jgi:tetratricopeptide (TPR) repeat protein
MRISSIYCLGLVVAVLLLLGAACSSDDSRVSSPPTPEASPDRERVAAFWRSYREATRLRLAGDYAGAASRYREALDFNPGHEDALYYLGNVAMELGEWSLAENSWQELVAVNSRSLRGLGQLGHLYLCRPSIEAFDVSRAESAFRESVRLNPEETGARVRLGQTFLAGGRLDSAAAYLDAVITTNPDSEEAIFFRSYIDWVPRRDRSVRPDGRDPREDIPMPEQQVGEGDTRAGSGPMLAPGAGCPLFEFDSEQTTGETLGEHQYDPRFELLAERLASIVRE